MVSVEFFQGVIETANVFISLFALVYAFMFLQKTTRHKDRLPWEFLMVAALMFFGAETLKVIRLINKSTFHGLDDLLMLLFVSFLLLSFIFQHNLFKTKEMVLIYKKFKEK